MAYAETTNPDFVNPFAETLDDPRELYQKIEAAFKKPRAPVYYEPQWEDPGLHGPARQVKLRGRSAAPAPAKRRTTPVRLGGLPPLPARSHVGEALALAGVAVGAGMLAWWLSKRRKQTAVSSAASLPSWAMT